MKNIIASLFCMKEWGYWGYHCWFVWKKYTNASNIFDKHFRLSDKTVKETQLYNALFFQLCINSWTDLENLINTSLYIYYLSLCITYCYNNFVSCMKITNNRIGTWMLIEHIFHSCWDVTITGEGLLLFYHTRHVWSFSNEGSLACNTYCDRGDTGHLFKMVMSEYSY